MTTKPVLQEILKGTLSGKERPNVTVGNTKAVKINLSVKKLIKELIKKDIKYNNIYLTHVEDGKEWVQI